MWTDWLIGGLIGYLTDSLIECRRGVPGRRQRQGAIRPPAWFLVDCLMWTDWLFDWFVD